MTVLGILVGFSIGGGLFVLRKQAWPQVNALGQIGIWLVIFATLLLLAVIAGAVGKGGDAGMHALILLFLVVPGIGVGYVVVMVAGLVQSTRLRIQYRTLARSALLDIAALVAVFYFYQSSVFERQQSSVTNEWWQRELARRKRAEQVQTAVPPQFKGITVEILDQMEWERKELAKKGIVRPEIIPLQVQNAIRKAALGSTESAPVPDRSKYAESAENRNRFNYGLFGGWIIGAFLFPLFFPKLVPPPKLPQDV